MSLWNSCPEQDLSHIYQEIRNYKMLTLSHQGDLIHSQPGGADSAPPPPLRNFAFLAPK